MWHSISRVPCRKGYVDRNLPSLGESRFLRAPSDGRRNTTAGIENRWSHQDGKEIVSAAIIEIGDFGTQQGNGPQKQR